MRIDVEWTVEARRSRITGTVVELPFFNPTRKTSTVSSFTRYLASQSANSAAACPAYVQLTRAFSWAEALRSIGGEARSPAYFLLRCRR